MLSYPITGIAAEAGHAEIVDLMIKNRIGYSHEDVFGCTSLHLAAGNGHLKVCQILLEADSDALKKYRLNNFHCRDDAETEVAEGHSDIMAQNTDVEDNNAYSKVSSSECTGGSHRQHRVLEKMTRPPDLLRAVDKRGRSAAEIAAINGHVDVLNFLRSAEGMMSCKTKAESSDSVEFELDEEADDLAYKFAKTTYFNESYDSIFSD